MIPVDYSRLLFLLFWAVIGCNYNESVQLKNGSYQKTMGSSPSRPARSTDHRSKQLEAQARFTEYYACLLKHNPNYRESPERVEAILLLAGQDAILPCGTCVRPSEDINQLGIYWTRNLMEQRIIQRVHIDHDHFVLTSDLELLVRKVTIDDAGQYVCYRNHTHFITYQLDVVHNENRIIVVEEGQPGKQAAANVTLPEKNLRIFSSWSKWSKCNACNKRGQRRRIGICAVEKLDVSKPVQPEDVPLLYLYEHGVPCRSTLLPAQVASLPAVASRASETLLAYCWVPCPTIPALTNITDKYGKVVEVVRTGEGYVSIHEGSPSVAPRVKRKVIYQSVDALMKLECPHDDAKTAMVRWQNKTQILDPVMLKYNTRGRVFINLNNELVIVKLKFHDTAPYSCWIRGQHIATIKLEVVDTGLDPNMIDYIILGGFGMACLLVIVTACYVVRSRKGKTLH